MRSFFWKAATVYFKLYLLVEVFLFPFYLFVCLSCFDFFFFSAGTSSVSSGKGWQCFSLAMLKSEHLKIVIALAQSGLPGGYFKGLEDKKDKH